MPSTRTPREFRTAVQASFKAHWDAYTFSNGNRPPVVWDNKGFQRQGGEYVHVSISHSTGTIAALGNEKYRRLGNIVINFFVPEGEGQARQDELAEALLAWFETFSVAGVRLRDPSYNEAGSFGGYWQSSIQAGFEYDAVRT